MDSAPDDYPTFKMSLQEISTTEDNDLTEPRRSYTLKTRYKPMCKPYEPKQIKENNRI